MAAEVGFDYISKAYGQRPSITGVGGSVMALCMEHWTGIQATKSLYVA
jgi:hypothetical protein